MYVALGHCVVYCGDLSAEVVFAFVVVGVCFFWTVGYCIINAWVFVGLATKVELRIILVSVWSHRASRDLN